MRIRLQPGSHIDGITQYISVESSEPTDIEQMLDAADLAAPRMASLLTGIESGDPLTLTAGTLVLMVAAAVAAWLPARRASSVDPASALRGPMAALLDSHPRHRG